ncbi:MAG: transcriptional regulator NrdR [Nitrospinota bacterium]|nr:transcriptional regulator NrdR [Nitrospinota bacterium]
MKCPKCSSPESRVVDSRVTKEASAIRRRRECEVCFYRFTTYEHPEISLPLVVKKDGTRVYFDRTKLAVGVQKALEKRPVPAEKQEEIIDKIERLILEKREKELESSDIGEYVMEELRIVDKVAYVRFASVYRDFKTLEDFMNELKDLDSEDGSTQ